MHAMMYALAYTYHSHFAWELLVRERTYRVHGSHHSLVGRHCKRLDTFHVHGEPHCNGEDELSQCAHLVEKIEDVQRGE